MSDQKISSLLAGQVPVGDQVTVKGWVRTRRDSKAGLSFVQVHDGTCFDSDPGGGPERPAQLRRRDPAPDRRLRGDLHRRTGRLPGQGPVGGDPGRRHRRGGLGRGSRDLPRAAQAPQLRVPARSGAPAAAHQHLRRRGPGAQLPGPGHAPLLPRERLLLDPHARSSPPAMPRAPARCSASRPSTWSTRRGPPTAASTSARTSSAGRPS